MHRPRLYLAGPLFSEAELTYNRSIERLLSKYFSVYLPQRDGNLFVDVISSGYTVNEAQRQVFESDCNALADCGVFLLIMDGRVIDEGAAFELGLAYAQGKMCCGLQTDPRRLLPHGNNPMISSALSAVFSSTQELTMWCERRCTSRVG
jgi:nucleoside 2-deoxyribosyltransferase